MLEVQAAAKPAAFIPLIDQPDSPNPPDTLGILLELPKQIGAERYQRLAAARLKAIRMTAGFSLDQMSIALTDVLGMPVAARQLELWEAGTESFFAGVLPAALDVAGVSEAEIIGLDNPDIREINRLEFAIARVRALLNDPAALTRRAAELLEGNARPLHPCL